MLIRTVPGHHPNHQLGKLGSVPNVEGAIAGVAMGLAAIFTAMIAPVIVPFFL